MQRAPLKKAFIRAKKPEKHLKSEWFDDECKCLLQKRTIALKRYQRLTSAINWEKYKTLRAEFSELIAKKQSDYSLNLLETFKSSRKTWNVINNLRNTKSENSRMSALMNSFGDLITEDKKIANLMNYTFSHLGDYGRNLPKNIESTTTPNLFSFRPTTIKEVFDAVKSLEINKPLGPCSIPAWAIKDGMTEIVPHLTMVIN